MACSSNLSGAHSNTNGSHPDNGENSVAVIIWTPEEQFILEDLFPKLAAEPSIVRYAEIAKELTDKTVRDVALRCRWMNKMGKGRRMKEDHNSSRKNKGKKEKVTDSSSPLASRFNGQSMKSLDGNPFDAIGGVAGQMLEQNQHALEQISANLSSYKLNENLDLFRQTRNNILSILNDCNNDMPKTMPPLPVKLNDELAKLILYPSSPMQLQQKRF